ncbi:MAG TPA: GYD domain-containing protein [Deltaproteobacteria bacterium]|nr:GYD domain-containing protein [Deltaproteobacteria bacterium]HPJ94496.1 GYD domain-containing protein [Deltaproteobacteria bacterium]HPR51371.1 GYD domain-containing protein [Deltaproteobacteria bacterium]
MATFFLFGKYSVEALKEMSADRTKKVETLIEKFGGKVHSMYALFGEKDLVFILDFPSPQDAMKASVAMTKLTGISFSTSPAVTVDEFDKLMRDI